MTKLKKVISLTRGKSLDGKYYSTEGKIIRLTLANFFESGGFKDSNFKRDIYYTGKIEDEDLLDKGTLITPLTEQVKGLLGSIATVPEGKKYIPCGDIGIIKIIDSEKYYDRFIFHLFRSSYIRTQLVRGAQKSKIRHVSADDFYNIEYDFPDINVQIYIADLLDNIDNKININNKINDNLEQQMKLEYNCLMVKAQTNKVMGQELFAKDLVDVLTGKEDAN
ncbi:restriction endonuclease subunit S, partial [Fusobacterium sp.]